MGLAASQSNNVLWNFAVSKCVLADAFIFILLCITLDQTTSWFLVNWSRTHPPSPLFFLIVLTCQDAASRRGSRRCSSHHRDGWWSPSLPKLFLLPTPRRAASRGLPSQYVHPYNCHLSFHLPWVIFDIFFCVLTLEDLCEYPEFLDICMWSQKLGTFSLEEVFFLTIFAWFCKTQYDSVLHALVTFLNLI